MKIPLLKIKESAPQGKKEKRFLKCFWGFFVFLILSVVIVFLLLSKGYLGFMPSFEELENPPNVLATEIYSSDKKLLGTYFSENRIPVSYKEISPNVINALISTEDIRFYEHSGIDQKGLFRVLFKTLLLQDRTAGGGSTISQQLAKLLFPREKFRSFDEIVFRKLKEWIIAVRLEKSYTKQEIIMMYLNKFDFLHLAVGIKSAANVYFNKEPINLTIEQAAMLIGMVKNPSIYNPIRRPERTKARRNIVLSQMHKSNYISEEQYDSLKNLPIKLDYKKVDHKLGLASYFREYLRLTLDAKKPQKENYAPWQEQKFIEDKREWEINPFFGFCNKYSQLGGKNYDLYTDGLKIYTTIDSKLQEYAEESVRQHLGAFLQKIFFRHIKYNKTPPFSDDLTEDQKENIIKTAIKQTEKYRLLRKKGWEYEAIYEQFKKPHKMNLFYWEKLANGKVRAAGKDTVLSSLDSILYYKSFFRASLMSMDPLTGHVKAYVGGPSYQHFMYDMVKVGKRQVGSTIKPFLYALAMQEGFTPCDKAPNSPQTFDLGNGQTWTPKNTGRKKYENQMVTLKWGLAQSNNNISAWLLKQFSAKALIKLVRKMGITSYLLPVPTICLGPFEISLYEMVGAYATFANKGIYKKPIFITKIEDKYGNIIAKNPYYQIETLNEEKAYLMLNLLEGVVNGGTASRVRWSYNLTNEIAGKTGTTQNQSDGWFIGVTQNLVTGIWVGAEDRGVHFDDLALGQGSSMALPIWGIYMQKVYNDSTSGISPISFNKPEKINFRLNCNQVNKQINFNSDEGLDKF